MPGYRKLGRTSSQRRAMLKSLTTNLIHHGRIITTETRAKEVSKIADKLIAMAIKEKDNFETVTVKVKVPRKDAAGHRVKETRDGKKVTLFDEVDKEIKKDKPSRLHARRKMMKVLLPVTEVPAKAAGRKKATKKIDLAAKLLDELGAQYENRKGGYTRIVKIGQRKGDAAMMAVLELV